MESKEEPRYLFEEQRLDLQSRISRIKVMLWANDYQAAHLEVRTISKEYGEIISKALKVRADLTSAYREHKSKIEAEFRQRGLKGRDLEHRTRELVANELQLRDSEEDALYVLSPIASTVFKLDKRITEQLSYSPPVFVDSRTRFRVTRSPYGLNQWEIRAYRFDAPEISPETLLNRLQENLDTPLSNLEKRQDVEEITWPLWLRGFRNDAFFDIKFYNPRKFSVSVTVRDSRAVDMVQSAILDAVAVCQDHS